MNKPKCWICGKALKEGIDDPRVKSKSYCSKKCMDAEKK